MGGRQTDAPRFFYNDPRENWQAACLRFASDPNPVVVVYTYWSVQWSRQSYIADLKRETRATVRGLAPVLAGYAQHGQWTQIEELFQRMRADGTKSVLLRDNGELWQAAPDCPQGLIASAVQGGINTEGFESEQTAADRYWFCRIVPLNAGKPIGHMLVAQEWTNISENQRERMLPPVGAAVIVVALIATLIPVLVSRYVSKPLADLSRKVVRFSRAPVSLVARKNS
jgi:pentatricopeptide repeat protein